MNNTNDMTVGLPTKGIIRFALPLIAGYILQQMYQIIDAAIVGRWIGVSALAAVGASSSIMFLILGFCNGSCERGGNVLRSTSSLCDRSYHCSRVCNRNGD